MTDKWDILKEGMKMSEEKFVVTTESGYRKEFDTMAEAIEEAKLIENSILHPIAFIHREAISE